MPTAILLPVLQKRISPVPIAKIVPEWRMGRDNLDYEGIAMRNENPDSLSLNNSYTPPCLYRRSQLPEIVFGR